MHGSKCVRSPPNWLNINLCLASFSLVYSPTTYFSWFSLVYIACIEVGQFSRNQTNFNTCVPLSIQQKQVIRLASVSWSCWKTSIRSAAEVNDCSADLCVLLEEYNSAAGEILASISLVRRWGSASFFHSTPWLKKKKKLNMYTHPNYIVIVAFYCN